MHRFVVILDHECDNCRWSSYNPIETSLTQEDLLEECFDFAKTIIDLHKAESWNFYKKDHVLDLGGTGLMISWGHVLQGSLCGKSVAFLPPKMLTLDEWFAAYGLGGHGRIS